VRSRTCLVAIALLVATAVSAAASEAFAAHNSRAACPAGSKRAVIGGKVKCLKAGQNCKPRYQAAYKRAGFTCIFGLLQKSRPTPQPTPTPTPAPTPVPPPAQPGHYHGMTSQLEVVDLDVTSDGRTATNIRTGQINQGCTPPGHISGGGLEGSTRPIASNGTFLVDFQYQGTFSDGTAYSGRFTMTGRFSGATVSGTLTVTLNFTDNGTAYSCGSGQQTWNATRTS
jgi:hypothetical protein